ncbi:MAG: hypothetical protein HY323_02585 [Betaproteobacteria bacterium]|nr:hypothetical protein [Betaproteobacteria bacterium]
MKIVGSLQGTAAFRASPDDIAPPKGIVWSDLIAKIAGTYKFAGIPAIQPGMTPQVPLVFQSGEFHADNEKIAIQGLFLMNSGAAVQTQSTEQSDLVLESLITLLDDSLGFRIRTSSYKRDYATNVVVQFEKSIESCLSVLEEINSLIRTAMSLRLDVPFSVKRLAFGKEVMGLPAPVQIEALMGLEAADKLDFKIERRINQPFSDNRYFAAAPMPTKQLFQTLEQIEKILLQGA